MIENPFKRMTYTPEERARSEEMWKHFERFYNAVYDLVPPGSERTTFVRKLQEALSYYEMGHKNHCKEIRAAELQKERKEYEAIERRS